MPGIPLIFHTQLLAALRDCEAIADPAQLRAIFATGDLYPFRNRLRIANSINDQVDLLLAEFADCRRDTGESVLVLFLHRLAERYDAQDAMYNRLQSLANNMNSTLTSAKQESLEYLLAMAIHIVNRAMIDTKSALEIYHHHRLWPLGDRQSIQTIEAVLNDLWDRKHLFNSSLPIFEYIERLANITEIPEIANQLRAWVDFAAPLIRQELTSEAITARRAQIAKEEVARTGKACYLTIEITPDFDDPSRPGPKLYSVETLLWSDGQQDEYWNNEIISGVQVQEVAEIVEDLIETQLDDSTRDNLTIEFLLPDTLFLQAVDQWPRKPEKHTNVPGVALGMDYAVVIRSLRRLKKPSTWRHWRNKWQYIQEHQQEFNVEQVFWLHSYSEHDPLILRSKLAEETIVPCVGMTFTFANTLTDHDSILAAMIETGIPVSFWLRPCHYASEQSEKIKEKILYLFANKYLGNLPKHLHRMRRRSPWDKSQDLGNHLTLLWDDPTRIPEKYKKPQRLQAPKIKQ